MFFFLKEVGGGGGEYNGSFILWKNKKCNYVFLLISAPLPPFYLQADLFIDCRFSLFSNSLAVE